jgi:predicted nucleic acid-binding OB-fold protein
MFKKYLEIITESKYQDSEINDLINRLDDDLIKELQLFNDFNDYYDNATIELKQIVNKIININKDKFYFIKNDFESLKEFVSNF